MTQPNKLQLSQATETKNVKFYGAVGDGVANDTSAILTTYTHTSDVYYPAGTYRISTTGQIGGTVTHRFERGAKFSIDSGVTLTLVGKIEAEDDQVLFTGLGSVVLKAAGKCFKHYGIWLEHMAY